MSIIVSILVCYGISNIVIYGNIFSGLRDRLDLYSPNFWGKLFSCMMCLPFWVGFFLSLGAHLLNYTQFSPLSHYGLDNLYVSIFLDSCFLSATTWLVHTFQEHFEES